MSRASVAAPCPSWRLVNEGPDVILVPFSFYLFPAPMLARFLLFDNGIFSKVEKHSPMRRNI
jgi:hypothetical protein